MSFKLVSCQIGVVAGGDVVVRQRLVHQLLVQGVGVYGGVVPVQEVAGKTLEAQQRAGSELWTGLVQLDQSPGVSQIQRLPLILSEEMEESLRGNDQVLAGVQT